MCRAWHLLGSIFFKSLQLYTESGVQIIENRNRYHNFTKSIQYLTLYIFYILGLGQYEAFSFQEDGFLDKQSNKEWAQLENKKLPELERLSICVWVKLHYHRTHNQVWSYCALKNFILVCSGLSMYNDYPKWAKPCELTKIFLSFSCWRKENSCLNSWCKY